MNIIFSKLPKKGKKKVIILDEITVSIEIIFCKTVVKLYFVGVFFFCLCDLWRLQSGVIESSGEVCFLCLWLCFLCEVILFFQHKCGANGFINCTLAAIPAHRPLPDTSNAATRLYYPLSLPSHYALGCYFHLLPLYQAISTVCLCKHN